MNIQTRRFIKKGTLSTAIVSAIYSPWALSQTVPTKNTLEEIVVTARKVSESMQSTPVAVSAMTEEQISIFQILDLVDVQRTSPNLAISEGGPGAASNIFIGLRGQTSLSGTMTSDPAIGLYVDGVYIARPSASLADMIDMNQIEVIRGPQGTLFGRNTTGGALNLSTNTPTDVFEGSLEAQVGNLGHREVTGVINVPITDQLASRFAFQHSEHDGYGRNTYLQRDLNNKDQQFFRGSLKYSDANDKWDATLSFDKTKRKDNGQLQVLAGVADVSPAPFNSLFPQSLPNQFATGNGLNLNDYLNGNNDFHTGFANEIDSSTYDGDGFVFTFNTDLGWSDLKYIGSYRQFDTEGLNDNDGTPLRLLSTFWHNEQDQVSHEIQLSGGEGIFQWIGGANWFQEKATELTNSTNFVSTLFAGGTETLTENNGTATNTSTGVFGQVYFDLTDAVTLTMGTRYTVDQREVELFNYRNIRKLFTDCNIPTASLDQPGVCKQSLDTDFDYWSYLVGIDWQVSDDVFAYAKTSQSYLAGGWNNRAGATPAFDPEQVTDVEFGLKVDWLDGRLRTNVAVFHAEQEDIQRTISVFIDGQPTTFIANAGSAKVDGLEFELDALAWEGMTIKATMGLLDAKYDEFTEARGTLANPIIVDRSNETVPQAPELTYSISATQEIALSFADVIVHVDYSYIDDTTVYSTTPTPGSSDDVIRVAAEANRLAVLDSYSLINAKATLKPHDSNWSVDIWGRNLGDEEYLSRVFADLYTGPFGYSWAYPGNPRTYGITAKYDF